jgi:hypothetical protein
MPGPRDVPGTDGKPETPGGKPDAQLHADSHAQTAGTRSLLQHRGDRLPPGHPSSPYNADGTRRPAAVSLRELEAAEETDVPESGQAGAATDLADGPGYSGDRAEGADDGVSAGWRAALPRLQGLWERHKERWPAAERSPIDRSKDEEGSWRGDGVGQYLNAEENLVTEHALDRVHDAEREVTGTMKAVEAEVPGARLVGLAHCLKGAERFKEKVAGGLALKNERSVGKVVNAIPDALRYTCQLPADDYLDCYRMACRQLQDHGYRWVFSRNSWENLDYKGVNTRWRVPAGQIFEVQFHTVESFEAKEFTHDAYKRLRDTSTDRREMGELQQFQREVSARIQVPDRVNEIQDFREKGG